MELNRDTREKKREFFPTFLSTIIFSLSLSLSLYLSHIRFTHLRSQKKKNFFDAKVKIKRKVYSTNSNIAILKRCEARKLMCTVTLIASHTATITASMYSNANYCYYICSNMQNFSV